MALSVHPPHDPRRPDPATRRRLDGLPLGLDDLVGILAQAKARQRRRHAQGLVRPLGVVVIDPGVEAVLSGIKRGEAVVVRPEEPGPQRLVEALYLARGGG